VIPSVIFNLNFQFNNFFSKTVKYHQQLFNLSVIPSVIFNLDFQFNQKISKTHQITPTTFQSVGDFVCKEQLLTVQLESEQF
jgi:hypothetical protein